MQDTLGLSTKLEKITNRRSSIKNYTSEPTVFW